MSRAGDVLVGGRSSRMGQDKALLPFRGGVLAQGIAQQVMAAEGLPTAVLLVAEPGPLENVNTPADWAAYARD